MGSWRDSASQQSQDDLDGLLNLVLSHAEQTLRKHGELYPFGASVDVDGTAGLMAAYSGEEHPQSLDVLEDLYRGAAASSESLRAVMFSADVHLEGGDAVRVEAEHRDGVA